MQREALAMSCNNHFPSGARLKSADSMALSCCGLCLPAQLEWWKTGVLVSSDVFCCQLKCEQMLGGMCRRAMKVWWNRVLACRG